MEKVIHNMLLIFRSRLFLLVFPGVLFFVGCSPGQATPVTDLPTVSEATRIPMPTVTALLSGLRSPTSLPRSTPLSSIKPSIGYTYHRADGNRYVAGSGAIDRLDPIDIPLVGEHEWLVAASEGSGGVWVVVLGDGRTQGFRVTADGYEEVAVSPEQIQPGMPPALVVEDDQPKILVAPTSAASKLTHPVLLGPNSERTAFIENDGDLVIWEEGEIARLEVNALPDARLLTDEQGGLLLLTGPTGRYDHGVLGDGLEASAVTIVETQPLPGVSRTIAIPPPAVIEGIAPIWADLNGDGSREIIITVSDGSRGARLVIFNEAGEQISSGEPIGRGYRWRNQLAVAPFSPGGELELVDVLTPHIGGSVEYFHLEGQSLELVAQIPGYTSHVMGSRNLDMALSGDFDGDRGVEVLLPAQERTELGAIIRTQDSARVDWHLPVGGTVTTNLAAISFLDGSIGLGVGRADGVLRLWVP
ncbi:MAG: hypothetical protein PVF74_04125 [Anaerolineales bacterium]|jgi:hypothetical protein